MMIPEHIEKIIERLEGAGHEAYIVGGSLRDMILGREPSDFDVTTSALPEETLALFSDMKTIPTGLHHGTVTVLSSGEPIEITTFRTDGEYLDSRHPESVSFTRNIVEDLARRDFTVNAIAYNKKRGFVDPFDGSEDIKKGVLRAVGDAEKRFSEDALRIMRALRFSAQLGFSIEENTKKALVTKSDGLLNISRERIGVEMAKLVVSKNAREALSFMLESGISKHVFGDYIPSKEILSTVESLDADAVTRFSCILWDCETETARKILNGLRYSNALCSAVISVLNSRAVEVPRSDTELRRFIIKFGNESETAADVREAISGSSSLSRQAIKKMRETGFCTKISDLAIGGNDLISMGICGKDIGSTLSALFESVTQDPSKNNKEYLINHARMLNNK